MAAVNSSDDIRPIELTASERVTIQLAMAHYQDAFVQRLQQPVGPTGKSICEQCIAECQTISAKMNTKKKGG
jgi:hypothetical protein